MPLPFRDLLFGPHGTTVEIHQAPLRRRMRKDYAAAAPIPGGMRPGARRRIAHTVLLRQGQGNAALLEVRFAAAAWHSGLEGRELRVRAEPEETWRCCRACRWHACCGGYASPRYPSASLGRPGRVQRLCALLQTGASVGTLPALLSRGEFRNGGVPPGAGPLGVGPVHPPKDLALKACARQLTVELAHHEGILGERRQRGGERNAGGARRGDWRAWPLPAIPILFQPRRGRILITLGDKVPPLAPQQAQQRARRGSVRRPHEHVPPG